VRLCIWAGVMDLADRMVISGKLHVHMKSPPTHVAVIHTTRTGEIEQVDLLNNITLDVMQLPVERTPEWLRDAVAVLRYCPSGCVLETPEVSGYKYTDFMLAVKITGRQYYNLRKGA